MKNEIIVIGQPPENLIVVAKEKGINLVIVEDQTETMIIKAPPIYQRTFEDFQTGQERRRERRSKKKKHRH